MAILFNSVLAQFGIDPVTVRLVRHQDQRADRDKTPYNLWRTDRDAFERYPSSRAAFAR